MTASVSRFSIMFFFLTQLAVAQQAHIVKFEKIEALINDRSQGIQIINFWATWCAPCVKELPLFGQLQQKKDSSLMITLVSLDFADQIARVNTFIRRKDIQSEVLLLDEIDYNSWIDKVDSGWEGAIPATLFINRKTGRRKFVDKELKEGEIESIISELRE